MYIARFNKLMVMVDMKKLIKIIKKVEDLEDLLVKLKEQVLDFDEHKDNYDSDSYRSKLALGAYFSRLSVICLNELQIRYLVKFFFYNKNKKFLVFVVYTYE